MQHYALEIKKKKIKKGWGEEIHMNSLLIQIHKII